MDREIARRSFFVSAAGAALFPQRALGRDCAGGGSRGEVHIFEFLSDQQIADSRSPKPKIDASAQFQQAMDAAAQANRRFVAEGTFKVLRKLSIRCNADLSLARLEADGNLPVCIEIGDEASTLVGISVELGEVINARKRIGGGWAGAGTGVHIINVVNSQIFVRRISGFGVGMHIDALSAGCAYNEIHPFYLENNAVNLLLKPSDPKGFVNENLIIGGRYHHRQEEGANVPGVRHIALMPFQLEDDRTSWPNNNVFLKPSIEGNVPEFHVELAGNNNTFLTPRWEVFNGIRAPKVRLIGHRRNPSKNIRNLFLGGYMSDTIEFKTIGVGQWGDFVAPRRSITSGFGLAHATQNLSGGGPACPILRVFPSSKNLLAATLDDSDWSTNEYAGGTEFKNAEDVRARLRLDGGTGQLSFGVGRANPDVHLSAHPMQEGVLRLTGSLVPGEGECTLGRRNEEWKEVRAKSTYSRKRFWGEDARQAPFDTYGAGSPQGSLIAPIGSTYRRIDGGPGTTFYVKEADPNGSNGWVAK